MTTNDLYETIIQMNHYIGLKYPRAVISVTSANFEYYKALALRLEYTDSDIAEFKLYLETFKN